MKVLITGCNGILGRALVTEFKVAHEVYGVDCAEGGYRDPTVQCQDVTDIRGMRRTVMALHPDSIIHAAAWTDVDSCENNETRAVAVNATATEHLAQVAKECGALFCYISTDYVFDGTKKEAYGELDEPHPLNVYGKSKWLGEQAVKASGGRFIIIRTSWLFGGDRESKNFVNSIIKAYRQALPLRVVHDQRGRPTYAPDLARGIVPLIEAYQATKNVQEYFHFANEGETTWCDFACAILERIGGKQEGITAISSQELQRPAERPANSVLSTKKYEEKFTHRMRPWTMALDEFLRNINSHS